MSWDGFLQPHDCKRCGQPLHGQGTGYPAELYAGTYNGLCYPCTGAGPFEVCRWSDGAASWSHPPHCPSWRRDRETYFAFEGCTTCRQGVVWRTSGGLFRESLPRQCPTCADRRYGPQRAYDAKLQDLKREAAELEAYARKLWKHPNLRKPEGWEPLWAGRPGSEYRRILREVWALPKRPEDPTVLT